MKLIKILFAVIFLPFLVSAQLLEGHVIKIVDGDTFTMMVGEEKIKIRLHGIDCPENKQDYSKVAKDFLDDKIAHKTVTVKKMDIDRYGRTVGMVYV